MMNEKFNASKPCLVLAPHLEYPIRNGGDILIDRKWAEFSRFVPYVDIIGMHCITRYVNGEVELTQSYVNQSISKNKAALTALFKCSHYHLEKFITDDFKSITKKYLSNPDYNLVISSFIWTATVLKGDRYECNRCYCIETHNNEMILADNHRNSSMNPGVKLVAFFTKKWAMNFFSNHQKKFMYIHVTEEDASEYLKYYPNHENCVVPVGVENVKTPLKPLESGDKVSLIFVGSLGVKMNFDALMVFRRDFYDVLFNALGVNLEVSIVGSTPSENIRSLCEEMGWSLYGDVDEQKLIELIEQATFSILPFHYVSGGKLKLFKTLAYGIPFLATQTMGFQMEKVPPVCVVSDNAKDWLDGIQMVQDDGISHESRVQLRETVTPYTWPVIANKMYDILSNISKVKNEA